MSALFSCQCSQSRHVVKNKNSPKNINLELFFHEYFHFICVVSDDVIGSIIHERIGSDQLNVLHEIICALVHSLIQIISHRLISLLSS